MTKLAALVILGVVGFAWPVAGSPEQKELTLKEVIRLVQHRNRGAAPISGSLMEHGVDFNLTPKIAERLRKAGADDQVLQAVWKATPVGRTTPVALFANASGAEIQANFKEAEAYAAIQDEADASVKLRMIAEFEKELPQSPLLPYVYAQAAKVYQAEGDYARTIEYAEKSLQLDPNNVFGLILAAMVLPEPRLLHGSSAENGQRLTEAEKDAKRALELIAAWPRLPGETEEAYRRRTGALAADAHYALGMVNMARAQFEAAAVEYRQAIAAATGQPAPQYYFRLGEAYASEGKTAEALAALEQASQLGRGTPIQQYADQMIQQLQAGKN